jgi:hypothetical protein
VARSYFAKQHRFHVIILMLGLIVPLCSLQCAQVMAVPHQVNTTTEYGSSVHEEGSHHSVMALALHHDHAIELDSVKALHPGCVGVHSDGDCRAPVASVGSGTAQTFTIEKLTPVLLTLWTYGLDEIADTVTHFDSPFVLGYSPPYRLHLLNCVFLD